MRRPPTDLAAGVPAFVAIAAVAVSLPIALDDDFLNYRLAFVGIYLIAIMGLNVLTGYSGQISLGHGAFMAIGAYATTILSADHGVPVLATIPVAGIVAGAAGFLFGVPALRLHGVYLALATFGLAVSIPSIAKRFESFTGGGGGKALELPSSPIGGLSTNEWLCYLSWGISVVLFTTALLLLRGRLGRAFRSIRDAPIAATSSGVSLARYKTLAFGIAACYAGVAGSLLAIATAFVNPDTFPVSLSILLLTGAVLGGLGRLSGMVFGAFFIEFVPKWAEEVNNQAPTVIYGLILLAVLFLLPAGAAGLLAKLTGTLKRLIRRQYSRADSRAAA